MRNLHQTESLSCAGPSGAWCSTKVSCFWLSEVIIYLSRVSVVIWFDWLLNWFGCRHGRELQAIIGKGIAGRFRQYFVKIDKPEGETWNSAGKLSGNVRTVCPTLLYSANLNWRITYYKYLRGGICVNVENTHWWWNSKYSFQGMDWWCQAD